MGLSAVALFQADRFQDVLKRFEHKSPQIAEDWVIWGRSVLREKGNAAALSVLKRGLGLHPDSVALKFYAACCHARACEWKPAEALYLECRRDPELGTDASAALAQIWIRLGFWTKAAFEYQALAEKRELKPRYRLALAACYTRSGRWRDAQKLLEQMEQSGGRSDLLFYLQGRCLEGLKDRDAALKVYEAGLKTFPESPWLAHQLIACAGQFTPPKSEVQLAILAEREKLLSDWTTRQRSQPGDFSLAHRIAILVSSNAKQSKTWGQLETAHRYWRMAVAQWTFLLDNEVWPALFAQSRSKRYEQMVRVDEQERFVRQLWLRLETDLEQSSSNRLYAGHPTLLEELQRERHACRNLQLLSPHDGFQLSGDPTPFRCGPLFLEMLNLRDQFPHLIDRTWDSPPDLSPGWVDSQASPKGTQRLRWLFSSIGFALTRLEHDNPVGALEALAWTICPECRHRKQSSSKGTPAVCRSDCPQFSERNMGLADLPDRSDQLKAGALYLFLQAHALAARHAIQQSEPDLSQAKQHWEQALEAVAGEPRREPALRRQIRNVVEERARLFSEKRQDAHVVRLIDEIAPWLDDSKNLDDQLVSALINQGVRFANKDQPELAVPLLRRAVEMEPELHRGRRELVVSLQHLVNHYRKLGRFSEAIDAVDEMQKQVSAGSFRRTAEGEHLAEETAFHRAHTYMDWAASEHEADRFENAANCLEAALNGLKIPVHTADGRETQFRLYDQCLGFLEVVCETGMVVDSEHKTTWRKHWERWASTTPESDGHTP